MPRLIAIAFACLLTEICLAEDVNLYSLTIDQLQKVPASVLMPEIQKLESRNNAEKKDLQDLRAFNQAMCKRLDQLLEECPAHHYLIPEQGLGGFDCGTGQSQKIAEDEFKVEMTGSDGKSFRLVANNIYVSDLFNGNASNALKFQRTDSKYVKSPRFRDLTSLSIVTVKSDSKIENRVITGKIERPANLQIKIYINSKPLLSDFTLYPPDDRMNTSEYRVNPSGLSSMGRAASCVITAKDLTDLQDASQIK